MLSCTTKIADRWRRAYSFVRYQEIDVSAVEHQSFQIVHAALIKLRVQKHSQDLPTTVRMHQPLLSAQLDFVVLVIDIIGKGEQITGAVTFGARAGHSIGCGPLNERNFFCKSRAGQ